VSVLDSFGLRGKSGIVTGCSSGLGITFAEALAEVGADLVVCARRESKLRDVSEQIAKKTGRAIYPIVCDVGKEEEVKRVVEEAERRFGKVDVLVNNAGVGLIKATTQLTAADWSGVLDINLDGTLYCARDVARLMIRTRTMGSIINIASIDGLRADSIPAAPYFASKGAVVNLTRALALEWAPHGIRVNAIAPGYFPSELAEKEGFSTEDEKYVTQRIPLGRWGSPDELKGTLLLLASNAGSYITGQTLVVDGGWTAK
jgi:NAD(P)-dependent dehydrogenase (short-subunit alcohol dehydrogenase family)